MKMIEQNTNIETKEEASLLGIPCYRFVHLRPIFKIGSTFFVERIYKKRFTIINREFNPVGASNSNCWYYTLSFDINRRFREDYLQELISGQTVLLLA